jgi:hypothetical protein
MDEIVILELPAPSIFVYSHKLGIWLLVLSCVLGPLLAHPFPARVGVSVGLACVTASDSCLHANDRQPRSFARMELPPPRKLKIFDGGWSSDDIKTFDKDRGREGNTHTHTHCSLLGKVVSFLL